MNMEIDLSPAEWLEKFIIISKEELELSKKFLNDHDGSDNDDYNDEDDGSNYYDDDDCNSDSDDENNKILEAQYDLRMIKMGPLFASQPRLKKICKNWENSFLPSCYTAYKFRRNENDPVNKLHEKANDLEYLIDLCGINLTCLNLRDYPTSQIMPIINANCPNLEELCLGFKEIMSQDFENCFSNMSQLKDLTIKWHCENSTLPMTLAKSIEQVGGTLKILYLSCLLEGNDIFSPDSLASVFPRLVALNCLDICGFGLSQLLLQSIGEMKNLADLNLMSSWPKNHPMFDERISMYPIANLKNLEKLYIDCDYGVRDDFLINLCNNAIKLTNLCIPGKSITDIGMSAIDNLEQLEDFNIGLSYDGPRSKKNKFITDESIQCLFNQKLTTLNISNCINITDEGVLKLVENLPNLIYLYITNTNVTQGAVEKIRKRTKHRKEPLRVY